MQFFLGCEFARVLGSLWRNHLTLGIEETIESCVEKRPGGSPWRFLLGFHDLDQFVASARIEEIERVVLQRGVNPRPARERAGEFGECSGADFLGDMQRVQLALKRRL